MNRLQRLARRLDEDHVVRTPTSSAQALTAFEGLHGLVIPTGLRSFWEQLGGALNPDRHHLRLWPFSELQPEPSSAGCWLFGDFLIQSHLFSIDLAPSGTGAVFAWATGHRIQLADTFDQFLDWYLDEEERLVPPWH